MDNRSKCLIIMDAFFFSGSIYAEPGFVFEEFSCHGAFAAEGPDSVDYLGAFGKVGAGCNFENIGVTEAGTFFDHALFELSFVWCFEHLSQGEDVFIASTSRGGGSIGFGERVGRGHTFSGKVGQHGCQDVRVMGVVEGFLNDVVMRAEIIRRGGRRE